MDVSTDTVREHYRSAARSFVEVMAAAHPDHWAKPALGVWTVRDLAGHTSRALLTVESYLDPTTTISEPDLPDPAAYYAATRAALADPAAVAERGRQAGAELGADPAESVAALVDRVLALVAASDDETVVRTPVGRMTLSGYLPSRTFELTVHTLDLASAIGVPRPEPLRGPIASCLSVAADLAAVDARSADVLLALTGRQPLPTGFSVV